MRNNAEKRTWYQILKFDIVRLDCSKSKKKTNEVRSTLRRSYYSRLTLSRADNEQLVVTSGQCLAQVSEYRDTGKHRPAVYKCAREGEIERDRHVRCEGGGGGGGGGGGETRKKEGAERKKRWERGREGERTFKMRKACERWRGYPCRESVRSRYGRRWPNLDDNALPNWEVGSGRKPLSVGLPMQVYT